MTKREAINSEELWGEVKKALEEETSSGYKIACIEAEKTFRELLRSKGYPTENLQNTLSLFGWKLSNKEALKDALLKTERIKNSVNYRLSSFEAEDIVDTYKQAIDDFSKAGALTWQKKIAIFSSDYLSFNSSLFKKIIFGFLLFFLVVKLLAKTKVGLGLVSILVLIADFIYSWALFLSVVALGILFFVLGSFVLLDRNKTKIKSIKEK